MTGWLVYDEANVARNRFFIDRWMEAARSAGIALQLVLRENIIYGVMDGNAYLAHAGDNKLPAFAVMRAQHPLLTLHLEGMGIPTFNNSRVATICNDKRHTHRLFAGRLPMMDTVFVSQNAPAQPFPYPVVVKASHSCGGRLVFLAADDAQYKAALSACAPDSAVVQPLCDEPGKDLRVYVLDNRPIAGMLRTGHDDFRSNVGQGGTSQPVDLTPGILEMVHTVLGEFHFGLAGIDFIFHEGRLMFNEIEDAVGTRMLYQHTGRDIASEYLQSILSAL